METGAKAGPDPRKTIRRDKTSVEYAAMTEGFLRGPLFDAMNKASKNALRAVLSEDWESLEKLVAKAELKGFGKIIGGIHSELAPHLLSTAAALGWAEGVRLLSPLGNQWGAIEANWETRAPSALSESSERRPPIFGAAPPGPYRPLGFACISGSVECAREIIQFQRGEKRFLTEDDYGWHGDLSTLALLVAHGGGLPLEAYIDAVGGVSAPDARSAMAVIESMLDGAVGPDEAQLAEAEAAQTLAQLIKSGMSIEPQMMPSNDKEYDRVEWSFSLWAKSLRESRVGLVDVFVSGGIIVDGPPGQHPLAVAAGAKDQASQERSAAIVKRLIEAMPPLAIDNGVGLLALERAGDAFNWPAATALAAAMSLGADDKARIIHMAAMRGGEEQEQRAQMALSHSQPEARVGRGRGNSGEASLAKQRELARQRLAEAQAHFEAVESMARRLGFQEASSAAQASEKGLEKIKARAAKAREDASSAAAASAIPRAVAGPHRR